VSRAGLRLVLDRDLDMAIELGAAGWHAGAQAVRALPSLSVPAPLLRLASAHDDAELGRARALGFDAAVVGPVLPTTSHPEAAGLGWPGFETLCAYAGLPVYAIGGVGPAHVAAATAAWAQGVAGISAYWPAN
jgi:8-oxo-dGTP diphosphatase